MSIAEVLSQLDQVKQHLVKARQLLTAALAELRQAQTLLQHTLGNVQDQSVYAVPEKTAEQITAAGEGSVLAETKVDEWIAKIHGTSGPAGGSGK